MCERLKSLVGCAIVLTWLLCTAAVSGQPSTVGPKQRVFAFHYGVEFKGLEPGTTARVWIPVAHDTTCQRVRITRLNLPGSYRRTIERKYGNELIYLETEVDAGGNIPIAIDYHCVRWERNAHRTDPASPCERPMFLKPTRLVPVDARLLRGWAPQRRADSLTKTVREIYDAVDHRMRYDKPKGQPWGRGDAQWACDNGFGNCTDFHSLFLAACRFHRIPSRFEIGFPIPSDRRAGSVGGYHCWASFEYKGNWLPVDISEADKHPDLRDYYFGSLDANRIRFTVGRDLQLEPANASGPINYLIYPHVEVAGRVHSEFEKQFSFRELSAAPGEDRSRD